LSLWFSRLLIVADGTASRRLLWLHIHDAVEGKAASSFAAAGLLLHAEPDIRFAIGPPGAAERLGNPRRHAVLLLRARNRSSAALRRGLAASASCAAEPSRAGSVRLRECATCDSAAAGFAHRAGHVRRRERNPVFRHAGHYLIGDPRRVSIGWRAACGKARVILLRLACLVRAGPASATRGRMMRSTAPAMLATSSRASSTSSSGSPSYVSGKSHPPPARSGSVLPRGLFAPDADEDRGGLAAYCTAYAL
jgi:hypothetical protein